MRSEAERRERSVMTLKWVNDISTKCVVNGKECFKINFIEIGMSIYWVVV